MSRYTGRFVCAEKGCNETSWREYDTRKEQAEDRQQEQKRPFKCFRHRDPNVNLRPDNPETSVTLVAVKVPFKSHRPDGPKFLDGLFWREEGTERPGSGYQYGPGFNAYASDFPEGTKLVVTTRVVLPDPTPIPSNPVAPRGES